MTELPTNLPLPAFRPADLRAPVPTPRPQTDGAYPSMADEFSDTQGPSDCVDGNCPRPLVVFIGGLLDETFGPVKKRTYPDYEQEMEVELRQQYVHYAPHDQGESVAKYIERNYDLFKKTICIVGHSWGGDTALEVCKTLSSSGKSVRLLVTLDPVGRIPQKATAEYQEMD